MKLLLAALTLPLLVGCGGGNSGTSYTSAADVAEGAGLASCKPDPQEVGVTDAVKCPGSTGVYWFKSHDALSAMMQMAASSPDTFLTGDDWAIECVRRPVCVEAQGEIGGDLS